VIPHPAQLLFSSEHPLMSSFDMQFVGVEDQVLSVTATAPGSFADASGGQVHTGFITLFLDTVMGSCVLGEMPEPQPIATVKLTCNHIRSVKIDEALLCRAKFDGIENSIAYIRGEVFAGPHKTLVAHAVGTFMTGTRARPLEDK